MESRNLTLFQHYSHNGTNRYSIARVVYPQNIFASSLVQEETLSQHRDSTDEDQFIEGECFVYIGGQQIFTIEIKQPDFVHQQLCIDLTKLQCPLECLTAFPLPQSFQSKQHILPLSTGILVVSNGKNGQQINLFDDTQKEIIINVSITKRIIWMNSRQLQDKYLLIIGFTDCSVGIYQIELQKKGNSTIKFIKEYNFDQLILYNDIYTHNQNFYVSLVSYNGIISILIIDLLFNITIYQHFINKITSPPKFYQYNEQINLMVPIQNGEILQYVNTLDNGLSIHNILKCKNSNENKSKSIITAFDIEPKKSDSPYEQSDEFEICQLHFDGTLSLYDFIDNNLYIELTKQLNGSRFYVSNMQLQFKQFIVMCSDDEVELYQMNIYHIN